MRRKAVFLVILLISITLIFQVKIPTTKAAVTITVPDNYPTIQGALNQAQSGDTIFIKSGTYTENIVFPAPLTNIIIKGENEYSTILNGAFSYDYSGYGSSINIQIQDLTITGFVSAVSQTPGINLTFSGCYLSSTFSGGGGLGGKFTFIGNTINGGLNIYGEDGGGSSLNNVIENNIFQNCGISLKGPAGEPSNDTVYGNTITNAAVGIYPGYGDTIEDNWIKNCSVGIQLGPEPYRVVDLIEQNTLEYNTYGLQLSVNQAVTVEDNNFMNNTYQAVCGPAGIPIFGPNVWSGNYWSDYKGTDANHNGIGDTPYVIDSSDQDNYPLMTPYPNSFSVNPTIDASAGTGGSINPNGYVLVNFDGAQTFSFTPNLGYHLSDVTVDGNSVDAVSSYSFTNVQAAHTITASFAINTFTISVTQSANGQISPGTSTVNYGNSQTFTITANLGYHIASLTVDGSPVVDASTYTFSNVEAAHTISATFAINTYTITVTQTANGVIAPGTSTVNYGDTPSFTITPNTGYHIATITANGASVTVTSPSRQTYQFSSVSVGGSLTATFAINTYTITVTQTSNGQITPSTTSVNYGGSQTFTITPSTGYYIASITTDSGSVTVSSPSGQSISFNNVQMTHTITATFALTSTPTPTPTPSPSPTPTSSPTSSPSPTPTTTPTSSPTPTSPSPTPTSPPTTTPSPAPTSTATITPLPSANPTPTTTPKATSTPTTTASPTQTPTTNLAPTETPSQSPSATASPGTIVFSLSIVLIAFISLSVIFLATALYFRNRKTSKTKN